MVGAESPRLPDVSLQTQLDCIASPVSCALVEKLIGMAKANRLPETKAVQMLGELVQLEASASTS